MKYRITFVLVAIFTAFTLNASGNPFKEDPGLTVYPNPATEQLNVRLQADSPITPEIRILDLTGKVVMEFEDPFSLSGQNFRASLDISELRNGIYFVKVVQADKAFTKKLVVR